AADRLGFPVVMKADLPGVAHKLAAGFVVTGVSSADATRRAFETLQAKVAEAGETPGGVLVEATATGLELICGMRRDPLFGPVVLIGLGGTFTELLHEVAVRVCPVSPEALPEMPAECAVGRFPDIAGIGREPLRETVAAISRLALEHPEIEELDVNPLFAGPGGVLAADALVVLRRHDAKGDDR